jgi:hypothetical protein
MSKLSLNAKVVLKDKNLVQAPNGDVMYMMNLKTGNYLYLNPVATQIWQHIKNPIVVSEVCQKLEAEFEVAPAQCQKEVLAFLRELEKLGNLEIR